MKLSTLGLQIIEQIDGVLGGTATRRGLWEDVTDFATAVAAQDGHLCTPTITPPRAGRDRDELLRVRKLVGIVVRNDLDGRWITAAYDPPLDGDPADVLEARVVERARADFNTFAEYVSTRLVPAKDRGVLGRVAPIVQAPAHREWARLWDRPENQRMIILAHNECAKTRQLSTLRPVFELGRDHNLKIAIVTNTASNAQAILRAISDLITMSAEVKRVFPTLTPSLPWNLSEIQVERESADKEPSVAAFGVKGAILGTRVDMLFVDDILDSENTSSLGQMAELSRWFKANVETRLTADARVCIVGTPWAVGDLLHELEQNTDDYRTYRFPILDKHGESTWPDQWPKERIEARRRTLREVEFQRCMMVIRRADSDSMFKEAHVTRALDLGADFPRIRALDDLDRALSPSEKIFVGVDLATGSQRKRADDSAIASIISDDADGSYTLVGLDEGRWAPSATKEKIIEVDDAFAPAHIDVEDNGGQKFFLDELSRAGLPVRGHTTTAANKHDAAIGLPGLATAFEQGKFVIPKWVAATPAGKALVHALLFFNPNSHTPDVLMAVWIAFSAAKTERRAPKAAPAVSLMVIGGDEDYSGRHTIVGNSFAARMNAANMRGLIAGDDLAEANARAALRDRRYGSGDAPDGAYLTVFRAFDGGW